MREIRTARERNIHGVTTADEPPEKVPRDLSRRAHEAAAALRIEDGKTDILLRRRITYLLYGLLALNTTSVLAAVFFVGFGLMTLSNQVIITLILETVAHVGAMFFAVTRYLFPAR